MAVRNFEYLKVQRRGYYGVHVRTISYSITPDSTRKLPHCSLPRTRRNATYRKGRAINRSEDILNYIRIIVPLGPENAEIWRATGIDTLSEKMDHRG